MPNTRDGKFRFRHQLLARVARLCSSTRETNLNRLHRYKTLYDNHVRNRHVNLHVGDQVLVRTYVLEPGRSSKLTMSVAGPYLVVKIDGPNVEVRTREGTERLHLDRVMRCPVDLPSGVKWALTRKQPHVRNRLPSPEEDAEFVIDRLISLARDDGDNFWVVRVRWPGYFPDDDTWEPASGIPVDMLRKYEQKLKLLPGILSDVSRSTVIHRQ
jgi:hypothetical protein